MPDLDTTVIGQGQGEGSTGASADGATDESQNVQPQEGGNAIDQLERTDLPPELEETRKQLLRDYHGKTQKLAEDKLRFEQSLEKANSDSTTLQQLMVQPWFQKAMEEERSRRSGNVDASQMTDEQFEFLKTDKNAFAKYVQGLAENIVNGKVAPALGSQQSQMEEMQGEREYDSVASKYKDFQALNEKGVLEPYYEAGYDYETAYQKYKWETEGSKLEERANARAQEILNQSRDGAVGKSGTPQINGRLVVKAKNFDEAFDRVWDAMKRGHKDVQVERG